MSYYQQQEQLEIDLRSVGSTPLYDSIFLFLFPPISLFSLVANLVSFSIFSARYFRRKPLYTYLRVVCLNSSLMNAVMAVSFLCDSRRYIHVANTELATYFRCYFKIPIVNTVHFYGSVIEIVLAIDRLVEFTSLKESFRRVSASRVCTCLFVACLLINAPYLLVFEPKKRPITMPTQLIDDDDGNTATTTTTTTSLSADIATITSPFAYLTIAQNSSSNEHEKFFYFYGESAFALSHEGRIFKNIQYFIRDILTFILLLFINIISLVLFKRAYRMERIKRLNGTASLDFSEPMRIASSSRSNVSFEDSLINKQQQKQQQQQQTPRKQQLNTTSGTDNTPISLTRAVFRRSSLEALKKTLDKNNLYLSVTQVRTMLAKMVFIICAFALCEHLFLTLSLQMFTGFVEKIKIHMIFLTNVAMLLKHSINFWIFFYFNTFFRKRFTHLVSKKLKL